jgi:hypothetical protein
MLQLLYNTSDNVLFETFYKTFDLFCCAFVSSWTSEQTHKCLHILELECSPADTICNQFNLFHTFKPQFKSPYNNNNNTKCKLNVHCFAFLYEVKTCLLNIQFYNITQRYKNIILHSCYPHSPEQIANTVVVMCLQELLHSQFYI